MTDSVPRERPAKLKVFLGYAAGVGKTYQMLDEAHERQREGVDVVTGYFEPHRRRDTIARAEGLEQVPRRRVEYRGTTFDEMDVDAILLRRPALCLVDELAHTNVPGSARVKRWEDVQVLLHGGIDVYTTMNIQHLESLNDQVYQFAGVRVRETVPDWFIRQADEVVMVDLTPGALRNRLTRGVVYAPEKAAQALEQFFREPTLAALRELALRQTAREVDARQSPPAATGVGRLSQPRAATTTAAAEKVLILVTDDPATAGVIRRGRRVADYLKADCFAVAVCPRGDLMALPAREREAVERHLAFARELRIDTRILAGARAAEAIVAFARGQGVSQILVARPRPARVPFGLGRSATVFRLIEMAKDLQVTVISTRQPQHK
jgi:two-component system, OmpR family, sensor histidine kinase KdpD